MIDNDSIIIQAAWAASNTAVQTNSTSMQTHLTTTFQPMRTDTRTLVWFSFRADASRRASSQIDRTLRVQVLANGNNIPFAGLETVGFNFENVASTGRDYETTIRLGVFEHTNLNAITFAARFSAINTNLWADMYETRFAILEVMK